MEKTDSGNETHTERVQYESQKRVQMWAINACLFSSHHSDVV